MWSLVLAAATQIWLNAMRGHLKMAPHRLIGDGAQPEGTIASALSISWGT